MKICLIGPTYPFRGGISHYTTLLYRHLLERHKAIFFAFKRQYPKLLFPGKTDVDPSQIHIEEKSAKRILDSINPISWISVTIKIIKSKSDILIIPWWVSFWAPQFFTISFLVRFLSGTKIVFICHNVVEHESMWIDRALTRLVLVNGNSFIVHSSEDKKKLLAIFPKTKIFKAHHPTYQEFKQIDNNGEKIRNVYNIKGPLILFFGFIREYKGLKYLLKSLPKVLKHEIVTLMIVGEFWSNKQDYINLVNDLGLNKRVILIDKYIPNEDVGMFFKAADIVVQPYVTATGSGIIQMAFGFYKPVIATKVGSLPEIVDDGRTGYLVSPKSSSEIANALIKFFRNKQANEFRKNIKNEINKFSWFNLVDIIERAGSV